MRIFKWAKIARKQVKGNHFYKTFSAIFMRFSSIFANEQTSYYTRTAETVTLLIDWALSLIAYNFKLTVCPTSRLYHCQRYISAPMLVE